jgi:hypothetical protein
VNAKVVILSCVGPPLAILNRPVGEALYRARLGPGDKDRGARPYRGALIFTGALLACLSFAVYE